MILVMKILKATVRIKTESQGSKIYGWLFPCAILDNNHNIITTRILSTNYRMTV